MSAGSQIISFLYAAILAGVPLLYGTMGEILTEKAGNLNLGVEGMMYMGAIMGLYGAAATGSALVALLLAALFGLLGALIYAFLTVSLKANQNVTGLTLTIFGTGFANFIGERLKESGLSAVSSSVLAPLTPLNLGFLTDIPVIGKLFFNQSIFTYLGVSFAVLMWLFFYRTRSGRDLRAVGENPAAADAAGAHVTRLKYLAILGGGALCGLGGAYVSLVTCAGVWQPNIIGGQGWIAVALVIFASWNPLMAVLGGFIFGALSVLRLYVPADVIALPASVFSMAPFIVTCVVLVVSSARKSGKGRQPAACGVNYFREER